MAQGTTLADASKRAGHSNPAITAAIYTHAVDDGDKQAAAIGDSLLTGTSGTVERISHDKGQEAG
jgi:integrase